MKRVASVLVVIALLSLGALYAAQECGSNAVLSGCVGDTVIDPTCLNEYSADHVVDADDVAASPGNVAKFCLVTVSTSLCPNTSAIATVTRNGSGAQSVDLNDGETLNVNAKEGDVLRVTVDQVPRKNGIQCIRQGDIQFALVR
ncbi:MAG: hypothetical protein OEQ13_05165 [Acidobacteriota bacterium]|nr:hypothetical protein [Acidobacteriota bacterium]